MAPGSGQGCVSQSLVTRPPYIAHLCQGLVCVGVLATMSNLNLGLCWGFTKERLICSEIRSLIMLLFGTQSAEIILLN